MVNNTAEAREQYFKNSRACRTLIWQRKRDYEQQTARGSHVYKNPKEGKKRYRSSKASKWRTNPARQTNEGNSEQKN